MKDSPFYPHQFVRSSANALGVGKVAAVKGSKVTIEYLVSPAEAFHKAVVPADSVAPAHLERQTRAYHRDPKTKVWTAGRIEFEDHESCVIVFPNRPPTQVEHRDIFVRWDVAIDDPTDYLALRLNETPIFHEARSPFVRSLVEQRAVAAGMDGLLSSVIDLESHQIEVARRILQDPVQRYLLADEVGLGKTIEAGILIRQYVLDQPNDHRVLVVVPEPLREQWIEELTDKFRLGAYLGESVQVAGSDDIDAVADFPRGGMLVLDEAHHVAAAAGADAKSDEARTFAVIHKAALRAGRLLLLSATPVLHNETAYQAMLHLLDPLLYPLAAMKPFRERIRRWQEVAELFHLFTEESPGVILSDGLTQLRDMFPKDRRLKELAKELKPLLEGDDEGDPERLRLVRAVRAHVSETYRLHRRLLRNRRTHPDVEALLPGRIGLRVREYDDATAVELGKLLEQWRALAAHSSGGEETLRTGQLGDLFTLFLEAWTCDPRALDLLATARSGRSVDLAGALALAAGEVAIVDNAPGVRSEKPILQRMRHVISKTKSDARTDEAVRLIRELLVHPPGRPDPQNLPKILVFASYPITADRLFEELKKWLRHGVVRHGPERAQWEKFLTEDECKVIVCDRRAEDGLNLQGPRTLMFHYDVPFSPNRLEQRLGRLDRFGTGKPIHSFTLCAQNTPTARAWLDCVESAYRVFERSVASLQHLIDTEMTALRRQLLIDGTEAIVTGTARLGGEEGLIETELKQIQAIDDLNAIEVAEAEDDDFPLRLTETDSLRRDEWEEALKGWAVRVLKFGDWGERGPKDPVRRFRFFYGGSGAQTMVPSDRFLRHFRGALDWTAERSIDRSSTPPLSFQRQTAERRRCGLARIGDPFVDALAELVHWDDRGVCFALWRQRPSMKLHDPAELAFRFDFLIEARIDPALAVVEKESAGSPQAVRRRADQLFPPIQQTVWLDDDLEPISDRERIGALEEPYRKHGPRGNDFNLNYDRWEALKKKYPASKWATLCREARTRAEKILRTTVRLKELTEEHARKAEEQADIRHEQMRSRLAYLSAAKKTEEAQLKFEEKLAAALIQGIRKPVVRLDALGAVFLSSKNPFGE